eukprot:344749_1
MRDIIKSHWYIMLVTLWIFFRNYDLIDMNHPYFVDNKLFFEACCDKPGTVGAEYKCGAVKLNYYPMYITELDWSLAHGMKIQLKTMYKTHEIGSSLENRYLKEWCTNILILICYGIIVIIENGIAVVDLYQKVDGGSLLYKYNRKYSGNSCWNKIIIADIDELEIQTCNDRYIENINHSSLDCILNFDGVKDNQYLIEIRRNTYDVVLYTFGADVNLRVCYGESDYKCNEYHERIHNELLNNINLLRIKCLLLKLT